MFSTEYDQILAAIDGVDPVAYAKTRNYLDGDVSRLSPYISRGVISTRFVMQRILAKGFHWKQIEKFIQELAWRDYWQQIWIVRGRDIDADLRSQQQPVAFTGLPRTMLEANTGITAIDQGIEELYGTGYMHNHMRMYVAALACNTGRYHWKIPAQWLYYHLLDADWASNALSWQWVAGTNSKKKYIANQENINKYCSTRQRNTFLDVSYEELAEMPVPEALKTPGIPKLQTPLPETEAVKLNPELPTLVYTFYNLDPLWNNEIPANRVLLLEPSHFKEYPIAPHTIDFLLGVAENIPDLQVFVGEFAELKQVAGTGDIHFREHPFNRHFQGIEEDREWMFEVRGEYPSFFSFWKKCKKSMKKWAVS